MITQAIERSLSKRCYLTDTSLAKEVNDSPESIFFGHGINYLFSSKILHQVSKECPHINERRSVEDLAVQRKLFTFAQL